MSAGLSIEDQIESGYFTGKPESVAGFFDDELGEEITCPNCGRDHIPDEGDPTQADTCWECQNGYGDDQ